MKEFDKLNILYLRKEDEEKFLSNEFLLSVDYMISINPEIEKFIKKGEIGTIPSFSFMHKEIK